MQKSLGRALLAAPWCPSMAAVAVLDTEWGEQVQAWGPGPGGGRLGGDSCPAGAGPTGTTDAAAVLHL